MSLVILIEHLILLCRSPLGLEVPSKQGAIAYRGVLGGVIGDYIGRLLSLRLVLKPCGLYTYGVEDLARLLDAAHLFEVSGTALHYNHLAEACLGYILPIEPVSCYRFLMASDPTIQQGESFIKDTRTRTIYALTQWIMDHLYHRNVNTQGGTVCCWAFIFAFRLMFEVYGDRLS